jgi:hypothetical protein
MPAPGGAAAAPARPTVACEGGFHGGSAVELGQSLVTHGAASLGPLRVDCDGEINGQVPSPAATGRCHYYCYHRCAAVRRHRRCRRRRRRHHWPEPPRDRASRRRCMCSCSAARFCLLDLRAHAAWRGLARDPTPPATHADRSRPLQLWGAGATMAEWLLDASPGGGRGLLADGDSYIDVVELGSGTGLVHPSTCRRDVLCCGAIALYMRPKPFWRPYTQCRAGIGWVWAEDNEGVRWG